MFLCLFGQNQWVLGQVKVLAANDLFNQPSRYKVLVKWYSTSLIYKEGVNVYRRSTQDLNWEKLNQEPIRVLEDYQFDSTNHESQFFLDALTQNYDGLAQEDILFLNVWIKSFESNEFAKTIGIYFEDLDVKWQDEYIYRVTRIVNNNESILGQSDTIRVTFGQKEHPISNFKVDQNAKKVLLDWEIEEDRFWAVNIFQLTNNGLLTKLNNNPLIPSKVEDSTGNLSYPVPKFEVKGLMEDSVYKFFLVGLDYFGNETLSTDTLRIKFLDTTPPPPPFDLKIEQDTMKVFLKWDYVDDPGISKILIYRGKRSEGPYKEIHATLSKTYIDSIRIPGPYFYYVATADHNNNQSVSNIVFADIPDQQPPSSPTGLILEVDTGEFLLSWHENMEEDLMGYLVYRTTDNNSNENVQLLSSEPIGSAKYRQILPKNVKNKFLYQVVAVDSAWNRSKPSEWISGNLPDVTAPERPVIKEINYTDENVVIHWVPNVEGDLKGYNIYRVQEGSDSPVKLNQNIISNRIDRYTDRSVSGNTNYSYLLQAVDSAGNVSFFSEKFPAKYVILENQGRLPIELKYNKRKNEVLLTWSDSMSDLRGYMIYRGEDEQNLRPLSNLIQVSEFKDANLIKERYHYQLRAYHNNGSIIKSEIQLWKK